jgi:catechol 1,2-dioxygenase
MAGTLVDSPEIQAFLDKISGMSEAGGNARTKQILRRIVGDLFSTMEDFEVTPDEFWSALNFLAAGGPEMGLWAAGLGFEHFIDIMLDEAERKEGALSGTPRTIEGPLYVGGAPLSEGEARLDDGTDTGETLLMEGQVRDMNGAPVPGAIVDVWHANTRGNYSYFDPTQSAYNLRRRIVADANGHYKFRSILPSGYAVPPGGTTDRLLQAIGRHGRRPAHIHFFVSAPGYRHLTTQINIAGDPDLYEDFAYATREELIAPVERHAGSTAGLNDNFSEIKFDFVLAPAKDSRELSLSDRARVPSA